ncbi:MAG: septum site-determining protein MinD [Oscillospiraceae bacterium]|nr:septum site-determining protein MinD [Oscillospiraceae bacterium]
MGTAIVVTSGKGGTGKTTVTSAVSSCLAALGRQVLCVDLDIGLRNLDLSLGMSDRAVMDFTDVIQGRCPLQRAAAVHPDIPGLHLLTAPVRLPPGGISPKEMAEFLTQAREQFDYILIDSPAGIGTGFHLAVAGADRAIVVTTNDPSALRDAQRTVHELTRTVPQIHLVMNRVQPKLLRRLHTTIDDAMDAAGLPLLGVIPDDPKVAIALGAGRPLILTASRGAAVACLNIAKRIQGQRVPLMKLR